MRDRVLGRPGLDVDAVLQENVGRAQDILAVIQPVGDMVQAAIAPGGIERVCDVMDERGDADPRRRLRAIIEAYNYLKSVGFR